MLNALGPQSDLFATNIEGNGELAREAKSDERRILSGQKKGGNPDGRRPD